MSINLALKPALKLKQVPALKPTLKTALSQSDHIIAFNARRENILKANPNASVQEVLDLALTELKKYREIAIQRGMTEVIIQLDEQIACGQTIQKEWEELCAGLDEDMAALGIGINSAILGDCHTGEQVEDVVKKLVRVYQSN